MNPGELRSRITIQQQSTTRDGYGGLTEGWPDVVSLWAAKKHNSSRDFFAAQKRNTETTDLFTIRFRSGISTGMRVKLGDSYYAIIGADDPDGKRIEVWLLCKAVT